MQSKISSQEKNLISQNLKKIKETDFFRSKNK